MVRDTRIVSRVMVRGRGEGTQMCKHGEEIVNAKLSYGDKFDDSD
jgi:hypothetical protein